MVVPHRVVDRTEQAQRDLGNENEGDELIHRSFELALLHTSFEGVLHYLCVMAAVCYQPIRVGCVL